MPCTWSARVNSSRPARGPRTGWPRSTGPSCWSARPRWHRPTPNWAGSPCALWLTSPSTSSRRSRPASRRGSANTANATVCQFVPHGLVLDRAICAITHGGMGSTVKALDRGVPVCVVPFARDQGEVARRVQVAACGTRLPAKKLSPARLRLAIRRAMAMADGARRVAAGFAATGGVARGADLIEQCMLQRARPGLPRRPCRRRAVARPARALTEGFGLSVSSSSSNVDIAAIMAVKTRWAAARSLSASPSRATLRCAPRG